MCLRVANRRSNQQSKNVRPRGLYTVVSAAKTFEERYYDTLPETADEVSGGPNYCCKCRIGTRQSTTSHCSKCNRDPV